MILAKITGTVVATRKNPHLEGNRILIAQPIDLKGNLTGNSILALDRVDAGEGDTVLVNKEGGGARILFQDKKTPLQAVVVGIVDRFEARQP